MTHDHDTASTMLKLALAWIGTLLGAVTLQEVVWSLTAIYTLLQIVLLIRDRFLRGHCKD